MRKVTRKEQALRDRYYEGACGIIESLGGRLVRSSPAKGEVPPYSQYVLMTDGGRLNVTVFDGWTSAQFARPRMAYGIAGCNPTNGKWNHQGPEFSAKGASQETVDTHLDLLRGEFERINARAWEPTFVSIQASLVDAADIETLRDREAGGEIFLIENFDKAAAAEEIASQVTDAHGNSEAWLTKSSYDATMAKSNLEAYVSLRKWRERVAEQGPALPSL